MSSATSGGPARVVVLAADRDLGDGMLEVLRDEGAIPRSVATSAEARLECEREPPDVLFIAAIESVDEIMRLLEDLERMLGADKPRVGLVFGLRSAGARFLPGVSYSLFAPASGARMREFIRQCLTPAGRELRHSGVRVRSVAVESHEVVLRERDRRG
jgi:hypothetical protein